MAPRRTHPRKRPGRRKGGLLYILTSAILILVVVVAGCAIFFRANDISVVGTSKYTQEEVIAASGIDLGDNLFLLPRFQIGRDICTLLPYIDEVSVAQVFPDGVEITVSECVPSLLVLGDSKWWVVDAKGKILDSVSWSERPDLMQVSGLTALEPSVGTMLQVDSDSQSYLASVLGLTQALVNRGLLEESSEIDLSHSGEIRFTYQDRFTVELPLLADYDWKIRALLEVVDKLQVNETGSIDMTRADQVYFDPA